MKRVAIIVQRCHESVVGGSEALAWQYAGLLKDAYEVDVLTTTAVDAAYWSNVLPEGTEAREGITIRRFHVNIGYSPYRTELFARMLEDFDRFGAGKHRASDGGTKHLTWSISLQEEFVRRIGPYSESLVQYLRHHWSDYRAIIIVTYLYPTAYFSLLEIPRGRALFAPTLHDEQPAYLSVYQHAARRAHSLIWLTNAERELGIKLWGELPGRVVAMAIDATPREPVQRREPYLLYCGRIDPNKGCRELFDYFIRFKEAQPSPLRLILTGKDDIPVPDHPAIEFRGFVSAEEKFSLMAGASVYVMPSGKESFSIVTLEALAQRTPVLVSNVSEVLVDHVKQSGGGSIYQDYESFAARLDEMLSNESLREQMGERGRAYVVSRYTPERIRHSLIAAVESCPEVGAEVKATAARRSLSLPDISSAAEKTLDESKPKSPSDSPPLPLPPGWTEDELRALVSSVRVEDGPPEEMKGYARADFKRFVYTLGLVPERTGMKLLELGANPYFTTVLLSKFREAELHLANFFGGAETAGSQNVFVHQTGETLNFSYRQFNIEEDAFPYPDDTFDVVLFCEIIEHLLRDPVHALLEIRRVLKPGGLLVLTTPNVARLENARKIIAGENIYDPYSGYGPYGRHNREYTQQDLFDLLFANGFTVSTMFTADVNREPHNSSASLARVASLVRHRQTDLGQYIFCQASVNQESKRLAPVRPRRLYRSLHTEAETQAEMESVEQFPQNISGSQPSYPLTAEQFQHEFEEHLRACDWEPYALYSVFTQYDRELYLAQQDAFMLKYRCFYAISKTISPRKMIEMGTGAGASGDAYLSATPDADYLGLDVFAGTRHDDGSRWDPYQIAGQLFTDRGFQNWKLIRTDLRTLRQLPAQADFVVVDAAHDFDNEYADLQLAVTAHPTFIFVDDADDESEAKPAIEKFLREDLAGRVDFIFNVSYVGGGLVIKLKDSLT